MTRYALGTFSKNDGPRFAGLVIDDRVAPMNRLAEAVGASQALAHARVLDLLERWDDARPWLAALAAGAAQFPDWRPAATLTIHPPVDLPRQVFCTGANYRKHVVDLTVDSGVGPEGLDAQGLRRWAENMMDERAANGEPYVFTKPVSAISGPFEPLVLPVTTTKPDWELELAVVIGRGGYRIRREDALSHVAGYAIVNDISARDLIARTDYKMLGTDWLRSKGQPGFLPFGPYLVPAEFVPRPHALAMRLSVGGRTMQDETTADMIFGIERQIEYISTYARLLPGDVICTGSPAGNGTHYNRFLQPGDVMESTIEGLGTQRTICQASA
ncbi:fumarylacetoacetate hydrolase family protein [Variovorax sp. LT1R16]|uniref:fumarylacetoacetate hydrolase family protein n=1 Tax=Variovorax sp. LT1R16 TaxID=3443728 RepID=UPI003F46A4A4